MKKDGFLSTGKDDFVLLVSQDGSNARSKAISVMVSLMMLNLDGADSEPKGSLFKRYASPSKMVMHETADRRWTCSLLYAASMSVLPRSIIVNGCRSRMLWMP